MRTKRTDHRKSSASRARRGAPASGRAAPLRALVTDADWRRLVQITFDGALIHDGRKVLDANASFARMFGYPLNRLRGLGVFDLLTEEGAAAVRRHMRRRVEHRFQTTCRRADGTPFPAEVAARNLRHNGRFLRLVAVRDLSQHQKDAAALKEAAEKYRRLMMGANDAILLADADTGIILEANERAESLFGRPARDLVGRHQADLHPPDRIRQERLRARQPADRHGMTGRRPNGKKTDPFPSLAAEPTPLSFRRLILACRRCPAVLRCGCIDRRRS